MNERIRQLLFRAIDEVNKLLPEEDRLEKAEGTVLSGDSTKLDSLGFVNLIVAIENKIEEEFSIAITLTDAKTASAKGGCRKTPAYSG